MAGHGLHLSGSAIHPASLSIPSQNQIVFVGCNRPETSDPLVVPTGKKDTRGIPTVEFFDGPHNPPTFFGPTKVLDAQ
jgi:hypothetical protein